MGVGHRRRIAPRKRARFGVDHGAQTCPRRTAGRRGPNMAEGHDDDERTAVLDRRRLSPVAATTVRDRRRRATVDGEIGGRAAMPTAAARLGSDEREWCPGRDLNPDELPHTPLKRTRIPIPPPGQVRRRLDRSGGVRWYRGRDLNPYALAGTSS